MRKIVFFLFFLISCKTLFAQATNPTIVPVSVPPTGSCSSLLPLYASTTGITGCIDGVYTSLNISSSALQAIPIASLPSASSVGNGYLQAIDDGTSVSDCSTGGGQYTVWCVSDGTQWSSISTTTSIEVVDDFYMDGGRTDSYTPDGSYLKPYKTADQLTSSISSISVPIAIHMAPRTSYSSSGAVSLPGVPITIYGNNSTWTFSSGITVNGAPITVYDLNRVGAVNYADCGSTARSESHGGSYNGTVTIGAGCYVQMYGVNLSGNSNNLLVKGQFFGDAITGSMSIVSYSSSATIIVKNVNMTKTSGYNIDMSDGGFLAVDHGYLGTASGTYNIYAPVANTISTLHAAEGLIFTSGLGAYFGSSTYYVYSNLSIDPVGALGFSLYSRGMTSTHRQAAWYTTALNASGTVTLSGIAPSSSTSCLQISTAGVVSNTGSACSGQNGTAASNVTIVGTNSSGIFVDNSSATLSNNTTGNAATATTATSVSGGTANVTSLTDTGAQSSSGYNCLQINASGVVSNTGTGCGGSNGTASSSITVLGTNSSGQFVDNSSATLSNSTTGNAATATTATNVNGGTASVTSLTVTGIEPTSTSCLQISASGVVSNTGVACGGSNGTAGNSITVLGTNSSGQFVNNSSATISNSTTGNAATATTATNVSGGTASVTSLTVTGIAPTSTSCLQISSTGVVSSVGTACNSGSSAGDNVTVLGTNSTGAFIDNSSATLSNNTTGNAATATTATNVAGGTASVTSLTVTGIAPTSTSCLQINSSGVVSNTGASCGNGAAGSSITVLGTNSSGAFVDNSSATLSNNTTGNAATSTSVSGGTANVTSLTVTGIAPSSTACLQIGTDGSVSSSGNVCNSANFSNLTSGTCNSLSTSGGVNCNGSTTAAQTVDIYSLIKIPQATTGITMTLATPTASSTSMSTYIQNTGTFAFTMYTKTIGVGQTGIAYFDPVASSWSVLTVFASNSTVVPISLGGTGATTAANALTNLGAASSNNISTTGTVTFVGIKASSTTSCLQITTAGVVTNTGSACSALSGTSTSSALVIGSSAAPNVVSYDNVVIGPGSGASMSNASNAAATTIVGYDAYPAGVSPNNTTCIGSQACYDISSYNMTGMTAVGAYAGGKVRASTANDVCIGTNSCSASGTNSVAATNGVYIGYNALASGVGFTPTAVSNEIVIGYGSTGLGSGTTLIGNSSTTATYLYGQTFGMVTASCAVGAAAGTGATCVCNTNSKCDNFGGTLLVTTGTSASTGTTITVTLYSSARTYYPSCVVDANTSASKFVDSFTTETSTGFYQTATSAPSDSTAYYVHYYCK